MSDSIDLTNLSEIVARSLGRRYTLTPLGVKCTFPVFKGTSEGVEPIFVKVGLADEWHRTAATLAEGRGCGLFPALLSDEPIPFAEDRVVFLSEWREASIVFPEDMTAPQRAGLVSGCRRLSAALQSVTTYTPIADSPLNPERLYAVVADYAARHPWVAPLLRPLLTIPAAERTFGTRPLSIIHGDFHAKNFGFVGDQLSVVYDFDKLTQSLACGDLANALMERFSCLGLSRAARQRLKVASREIVASSPWPREDFVIVCNQIRLAFAARRIEKHPDSAWVALDIARRDRRLREFLV